MRAVVILCAMAMAIVTACSGEVNTPPNGRAVIASRSSELSVGDTMTLSPGVQYNDGRWVPLDTFTLSVIPDTTYAAVDQPTRLLRGKKAGTATVKLDIPNVGSITRDFVILP